MTAILKIFILFNLQYERVVPLLFSYWLIQRMCIQIISIFLYINPQKEKKNHLQRLNLQKHFIFLKIIYVLMYCNLQFGTIQSFKTFLGVFFIMMLPGRNETLGCLLLHSAKFYDNVFLFVTYQLWGLLFNFDWLVNYVGCPKVSTPICYLQKG